VRAQVQIWGKEFQLSLLCVGGMLDITRLTRKSRGEGRGDGSEKLPVGLLSCLSTSPILDGKDPPIRGIAIFKLSKKIIR
jgi:hypothetical protein